MSKPQEPMSPGQSRAALAMAVIEYLERHPQAMDTFAGIAEWWIPASSSRVNLDELRRTLEDLARRGILEEIVTAEQTHYRLKRVESGHAASA